MHNPSEMIKQGYRPGAPSSKAEEIDAEVVDGTICKCGAEMHYEAWHKPGEYIALAVCSRCGRIISF